MPSPWSRPRYRRASITAISQRCFTCRVIAAAILSKGTTHDRHPPDRARQAAGGRRDRGLFPQGKRRAGRTGRRPGADPVAFSLARSRHAPAHDRAALLQAAIRARQTADRRVGGRGGRVEEPALCQRRHRDRHAELGDPYAPRRQGPAQDRPGDRAALRPSRRARHAELHRLVRHPAHLQTQGGRDGGRFSPPPPLWGKRAALPPPPPPPPPPPHPNTQPPPPPHFPHTPPLRPLPRPLPRRAPAPAPPRLRVPGHPTPPAGRRPAPPPPPGGAGRGFLRGPPGRGGQGGGPPPPCPPGGGGGENDPRLARLGF